jgi:TolB protein
MIRALSFLALLGVVSASSFAQTPVITIEGGKLNIALGGFSGSHTAAKDILVNDLTLSGAFKITPPAEAPYTASAVANPDSLTGTLTDRSGAILFSETFRGETRSTVHQFADAIVEKLTNQKGIATSKVAFISEVAGKKEVHLMDIDGANVRQLTNDKSLSLGPKFSPDGNLIAYSTYKGGYPDIWIIDLAAKSRRPVATFPGTNQSPAFSPNGTTLAAILSKDGNTELYTLSIGGGAPFRLTRTSGTEATPSWSPDGSTIAFISDDRGSPQLLTIPAAGGSPSRINTASSYTTEPDWSPDGKKIAYSVRVAGGNQIAFTTLATGEQKVLTSSGTNETPSWTRNSRHLVYARGGALYLLDSLTRESVQIKNNLGKSSEPSVTR